MIDNAALDAYAYNTLDEGARTQVEEALCASPQLRAQLATIRRRQRSGGVARGDETWMTWERIERQLKALPPNRVPAPLAPLVRLDYALDMMKNVGLALRSCIAGLDRPVLPAALLFVVIALGTIWTATFTLLPTPMPPSVATPMPTPTAMPPGVATATPTAPTPTPSATPSSLSPIPTAPTPRPTVMPPGVVIATTIAPTLRPTVVPPGLVTATPPAPTPRPTVMPPGVATPTSPAPTMRPSATPGLATPTSPAPTMKPSATLDLATPTLSAPTMKPTAMPSATPTLPASTMKPTAMPSATPTPPAPTPTPPPTVMPSGVTYPVDVVLVLDRSSSMKGERLADAKQAAKTLIEIMDLSRNQVSLVTFARRATVDLPLSQDATALEQAIDAITTSTGTNIAEGLVEAAAELTSSRHNPAADRVMILLSDGRPTAGDASLTVANSAKMQGIRIIMIGLGANANTNLLRELASNPDTDYYYAPDSTNLERIYETIAGAVQRYPTPTSLSGPVPAVTTAPAH